VNDGEESGGINVTLLVNQNNGQTGIDVFNYMINNSIISNPPGESDRFVYDWYAKDNDNILLSGTFDGITLDNVRVIKANNYPNGGVNYWFELDYEGKGSFISALLYKDGLLECYDDE
jgi:hypothetical protein